MKNTLCALLLAIGLTLGLASASLAQPTTTNDPTLTWIVSGSITDLPGHSTPVAFRCTAIDVAHPYCYVDSGILYVNFLAADATHFGIVFVPTEVCGVTSPKCAPALVTGTESIATTCIGGVFTATSTLVYNMPCTKCFGGLRPQITVAFTAVSAACT